MQEREADDGNLGEVAGEERGARRGREVKGVEAFATSREGRGFPPDLASSVFFCVKTMRIGPVCHGRADDQMHLGISPETCGNSI